MENLWQSYVAKLVREAGHTQMEAQRVTGVRQTTISRWLQGTYAPTDAARVIAFAKGYGRNVLEAFVAADMLDEETAQSGLGAESLDLLAELREAVVEHDELARRRRQRSEPSVGDPNVAHLYEEPSVAHPEPRHDVEGDEEPEGP